MAKPFAKLQVGYRNHPKFAHLNANAFALWHEAKDYCAEFLTDGLLPMAQVKKFRFYSPKAVEQLMRPCGLHAVNGEPMSALWVRCEIGYRMHDYLDHNDSREVVLERMSDADEISERKKAANRERQRRAREKRREDALRHAESRSGSRDVTQCHAKVSGPTDTATSTPLLKEQVTEGEAVTQPPRPRPMAPIHNNRAHLRHVVCGRACLHESQFDDFVRRRNGDRELVRTWAEGVAKDWAVGAHAGDEPGDAFDFWRARYAEQWPPSQAALGAKPKPVAPDPYVSWADHPSNPHRRVGGVQ